jgi:hypothetical protein
VSRRRPSDRALGVALALGFVLGALALHARWDASPTPEVRDRAAIVARLGLTDLCLSTEARYTRHLSQADRFAPFQDHPSALEHFPSGSLLAIPAHVRGTP